MFWTEGELSIFNGFFSENEADDRGGVFIADEESVFIVQDGIFEDNEADDGAVAFASEGSKLYINGGIFRENEAENGGGVFYVDEETTFEVSFSGRRRRGSAERRES